MANQEPELTCIFGIRGSGKTTWLRHYASGISNVLAYDFLAKFDNMVIIPDWLALREYFEKGKPPAFRVSFRPTDDIGHFDLCCKLVKALAFAYGKVLFCIDEVDRYCSASWEPENFRELIAQGRNWGISIAVTSRTPAEISKLLTSQASRFVCFTMHERRHVDYIASHIGEKAQQLPTIPFYTPIIHDFQETPPPKNT